jgi:ferritin-like metal-binding protein YciE
MADMDERLDRWLRDAHAMEEQAEGMLQGQVNRHDDHPQLRSRLEEHLAETKSQRERLEACLYRRGISYSGTKDIAAGFKTIMQGVRGVMAEDEAMKGILASYAFEHMEIASYQILIAAAEAAGDQETANVSRQILEEEEAMVAWLAQEMPEMTRAYLAREEIAAG